MKKLIFCLIITSCSVSKNTDYASGYEYSIPITPWGEKGIFDVELSTEYVEELRENLIQVGIVYKDTTNE